MTTLEIDIETYSAADLTRVGVYKYAYNPSFNLLLFGYSLDGSPVEVVDIKHGERLPVLVQDALFNPEVTKVAFNAQFERVCLESFFKQKIENWDCTMAQAWRCGITGGLETVGAAVGLPPEEQKLKEGKRLIRKFCVPQKTVHVQPELPGLVNSGDWELFKEYCRRDVEVEQAIRKRLERFPTPIWEQGLYTLDQRINDYGIKLDTRLIAGAIAIDDAHTEEAERKYQELTGMDNPNSLIDIKAYIYDKTGVEISSLTKANLDDLLEDFREVPSVVEVLKIRKLLRKTSTAKYRAMQAVRMEDGRSRGNFQYYGAKTGRWAGRLIQVQNLPKNYISDLDTARELVAMGDYPLLDMCYPSAPDVLSQCLRTAIVPEDGCKFVVADFSAIEARVLAWLAGETWVLDVFRGDGRIYEATAARMFGVPVEDVHKGSDLRQKGKVATLALGYQGGSGSLVAMGALKMGLKEEELPGLVELWRARNPNIVRLWAEVDTAVKKAVTDRTPVDFAGGKCRANVNRGILWITLPSKRKLAYCRPRLVPHHEWAGSEKIIYHERAISESSWIARDTYGGRLVENITQAVARDCLAWALMAVDRAGYKIVMHIHDEIVVEVDKRDDNALDHICRLMTQDIEWAPGLPLDADGYECAYYRKD